MRARRVARIGVLLALVIAAAGCSRKAPNLMRTERGQITPDEFAILPSKPIEMPSDFNALPPPNPGGGNRTDVHPLEEGVIAFGGNPARIREDGTINADPAFVRQATRYGVQPNVRAELAAEDLQFRSRNRGRLLERWLKVPTYYRAYRKSELNQHATNEIYRRAGAPTPAAPPESSEY